MTGKGKYRLKVCGMRDPENIAAVAGLGPDYMGFIFYPPSPRYVGDGFDVPETLPEHVSRTGVFVDQPLSDVVSAARRHSLSVIQLHGKESPAVCAALQGEGLQVIKVFSVDDEMDFARLKPYEPYVNYFLFDTKGKYYGGNAKTFNWEVLKRYDQRIPFFLSGGLSAENVGGIDRLGELNLFALDVNSGVEDKPGIKNIGKLKAFIEALSYLS